MFSATRRHFLGLGASSLVLTAVACASGGAGTPATPTAVKEAAPTVIPSTPTPAAPPTPAATPTPTDVKRSADAAAYTHDDKGHPTGALSPFTVTIAHGPPDQQFRLGFFETDVGQLGQMWTSAAWMATSVGALLTGQDINTLRVSWETKGFIDGPSAGGLMTAAFISGLLGHDLSPDVAMTGTINPDGSIGPVGGINYKLEAVAKAGKKTFLIPIGQRYQPDEETKQTVDVIQQGKLSNVTVQEVATLAEAYKVLTDKDLNPGGVISRAPELSSDAYDRLKPKVLDWAADYKDAMGRFRSTPSEIQKVFADTATEVDGLYAKADKALTQGDVSSAYNYVQAATAEANALAIGAQAVATLVQSRDVAQAANVLLQSGGASRVDALFERLKALAPSTTDDAILAISAWADTLSALALDQAASQELDRAKQAKDDTTAFTHLYMAAVWQSTEKYLAKSAEDLLTLGFGKNGASSIDPKALSEWAGVFKHAAEANLAYFDSIVLNDVSTSKGVSLSVVKQWFQTKEMSYSIASYGASPALDDYLAKKIGNGPAADYATLGFSVRSYLASSELVTKYYSLDAQLDKSGNITGYGNERALTAMLDAATDQAKTQIAGLTKAGGDASLATMLFLSGAAERDGNNDDKMSALGDYWAASLLGRLAVLIARKSG